MEVGTLVAFLRADKAEYDEGLDAAGRKLRDTAEDADRSSSSMADKIDRNFGRISAAGVAAGGALEAFARSQQENTAGLRRTAVVTGETEASLRGLAVEMSGFSGSSAEMARGMERLTESGITTREGFEAVLPAVDALASATGQDLTSAIDTAESVLAPLGIGLEDVADHTDQLTRMMTQAGVPMGSLSRNLARVPEELAALGFGLDDAAAGVQLFSDRGYEGREAVREFRRAVAASGGDMDTFLETIGLTAEQWAAYGAEVAPATNLTREMAAANESVETPLQRLRGALEDAMFAIGGYGDAAAALALPLMALGPVSKMVVGFFRLMGNGALVNGAKMAAGWVMAMGPVGWVTAAVVGLVALIIANWDTVVSWTEAAWSAVSGAVGAAIDWVVNVVSGGVATVQGILAWFGQLPGLLGGWFMGAANAALGAINSLIGFVAAIPGRVLGALGNVGSLLVNAGHSLIMGLWNGIKRAFDWVVSQVSNLMGWLRGLLPFSPAKRGPFSGRGYTTYSGQAMMRDFAKGIESEEGRVVGALEGTLQAGNKRVRGARLSGRVGGGDGGHADALYRAVRDALDGARMEVDGSGVARLVNRQNTLGARRGVVAAI